MTALEKNGKFSKAYGRLAKSYMALGDLSRALENYEKAVEAAPTDREVLDEQKECKQVHADTKD